MRTLLLPHYETYYSFHNNAVSNKTRRNFVYSHFTRHYIQLNSDQANGGALFSFKDKLALCFGTGGQGRQATLFFAQQGAKFLGCEVAVQDSIDTTLVKKAAWAFRKMWARGARE